MKKLIILLIGALWLTTLPAIASAVNLMTTDELKSMLDSKELVILDVRAGRDWSTSEFKIKGAIRASGDEYGSWANAYSKDNTIVLYCA